MTTTDAAQLAVIYAVELLTKQVVFAIIKRQ